MQIQKDHFSQSYSIIGMDLFAIECPDLKSFKALLLTGDYKNTGKDCKTESIDQSLQAIGIKKSTFHDLTLYERLMLLLLKRSFMDTELDIHLTDKLSLSAVVHFLAGNFGESSTISQDSSDFSLASIAKFTNPAITLENSIIVRGSFENALERSLLQFQKPSCDYVALLSFFTYSNPNKEKPGRDSIQPAGEFESDLSIGLGCVVLSNQNHIENSYSDLVWQTSQVNRQSSEEQSGPAVAGLNNSFQPIFNTLNHLPTTSTQFQSTNSQVAVLTEVENQVESLNEELQNGGYQHFRLAPIIRLIQSALSLNSQTYFPNPNSTREDEELADEKTRGFIRPWFPLPYAEKRESVICLQKRKDYGPSIRLEKGYLSVHHTDKPFSNFGLYLLLINFNDPQQVIQSIDEIQNRITDCPNLADFNNKYLAEFGNKNPGTYSLVVLGSSKQEFIDELDHARIGVLKSLEGGRDWQTPAGSYFTPNPFGPEEKIAFVYPGAFGTYVGMGREIFYLFPQLHDALLSLTSDPGNVINEASIFPQNLTSNVQRYLQNELNNNPTQMISSGICFSYLFTVILRDIFKVKPDAAFGYSLGENSMMFAMGIWTQADVMRTSMEASPVFHERVSGPQNAIRDFWNLPKNNGKTGNSPTWANYVLMASYEKVREAILNEDRVYITHINTPRQVVIGGDKNACQRVADAIKCMYLQTPYHHAIHCEPVTSEFDAFMRLNDWPVENKPDIPIYTAANYATLQYDSKSIKRSFAKMLTNPIDFPRLINLAYEGGTHIFIELGAGSNCSKWVEATLKGKPHLSISINQNSVDDHVSILRLLARLVSHQVPVDLKVLRGNSYGCKND
jgi:PfaB family protein